VKLSFEDYVQIQLALTDRMEKLEAMQKLEPLSNHGREVPKLKDLVRRLYFFVDQSSPLPRFNEAREIPPDLPQIGETIQYIGPTIGELRQGCTYRVVAWTDFPVLHTDRRNIEVPAEDCRRLKE
jgi:hypothetical protein